MIKIKNGLNNSLFTSELQTKILMSFKLSKTNCKNDYNTYIIKI